MPANYADLKTLKKNTQFTVFESVARTATVNSEDYFNPSGDGIIVTIDCTAIVSTPSVVFTIQGKDPASAKYYTILASAASVGTGTTVLRVYPGLTAAANTIATDMLPRDFRIIATHGNANSITYTVGACIV